jgi:hypothetical protein
VRARARSRALLVLGLFLATNALPRAGLYVHPHAGGDHAHAHPWGADVGADAHGDAHEPRAHDGGPGLEDADPGPAAHAHSQPPFQPTATPEAPRALRATVVRGVAAVVRQPERAAPASPAFARGPPPGSAA